MRLATLGQAHVHLSRPVIFGEIFMVAGEIYGIQGIQSKFRFSGRISRNFLIFRNFFSSARTHERTQITKTEFTKFHEKICTKNWITCKMAQSKYTFWQDSRGKTNRLKKWCINLILFYRYVFKHCGSFFYSIEVWLFCTVKSFTNLFLHCVLFWEIFISQQMLW